MYNRQPRFWASANGLSLWKPLMFIGANLIILAILIFIFPALLAYLIAAFLLFNGSLLLAGAYHLREAEKRASIETREYFWSD